MTPADRMDGLSERERLRTAKEVFGQYRRYCAEAQDTALSWDGWVEREMRRAEPVRRNCGVRGGENRDFARKAENSPSGALDAPDDKGQGPTPKTPPNEGKSALAGTTGGKASPESPKRWLIEMTDGMDGKTVVGKRGGPLHGVFESESAIRTFILTCCRARGWRLADYRRGIFLRPGVTVVDFGDYGTFARVTELP